MANTTVGIVLKASTDAAQKGLKAFGGAAKVAFAAAAGAAVAAAGAIAAVTMKAAGIGDALLVMSDRTGASTEFLSAMGHAAVQSGASMEAMEKAISTVSKNALAGTKTFDRWGVSIKNSDGTLKNSEQLFASAADKISSLKSGTAQLAAAQDLFGRSGRELLPILRGGSAGLEDWRQSAEETGVVIDSLSARLGGELDDQLTAVESQFDALSVQVGTIFMPIGIALTKQLREITAALIGWFQANNQLIDEKLTSFLIWLADNALPAIATAASIAAKAFYGWIIIFNAIRAASAAFFTGWAEAIAVIPESMAKITRLIGGEHADEWDAMAAEMRSGAAEFFGEFTAGEEAIRGALNEIDAIDAALGRFAVGASGALRRVAVEAAKIKAELAAAGATGNATTGGDDEVPAGSAVPKPKKPAKQKSFYDEALSIFSPTKQEQAEIDEIALAADQLTERLKAQEAQVKVLQAQWVQFGTAMGEAMGTAFGAMIFGSESATDAFEAMGKQMLLTIVNIAEQQIVAAAAAGAASSGSQAANSAPFPYNIALIPIAAAAAFGLIRAFIGQLHVGGVVPGPLGQERMMVLQSGEQVSSIAETRAGRNRSRQTGGDTTIIEKVQVNALAVPSQAGWQRTLEDGFMRTADKMQNRGAGLGRHSRRPLEGVG